jgi:hypothetical protein
MNKLSDHFIVQEFVPPDVYARFGDGSSIFIDDRLIAFAEKLRRVLDKPIVINNWHNKGAYSNSGLRSFSCPEGALFSDHKFGKAIDIKVANMSGPEVADFLEKHWADYNFLITSIEKGTPSWTHVSTRFVYGLDKSQINWIPYK